MKIIKNFELSLIFVLLFYLGQFPVYGQLPDLNKQKPVVVEIVPQPESPLVITPIGVDTSYQYNLKINYNVKNVGEKKVKAFIITQQNSSSEYSSGMDFFSPLNLGQTLDSWNVESKVNVKPDSKIFLSVDFILFADETSWGKSTKSEAEFIYGFIEGQKKMLSELKIMLKTDKAGVSKLLEQKDIVIDIKSPKIDKTKSEDWKVGYVVGYKVVWVQLKDISEKHGVEMLPLEPEDFYNTIEPMRIAH